MKKHSRLLEAGRMGTIELKNRYVMPPMVSMSATRDGMVTDAMVKYYTERAKGDFGLIIVEFAKCDTTIEDWKIAKTLRIDTAEHAKSFLPLTESVHKAGAKIALQITPGSGSWIAGDMPEEITKQGFIPVGPTTFAFPGLEARPLETEEVEALVRSYGEATLRAKKVGFDVVEIHGHSSYLLGQFMSPWINNRDDKYGDLWRLPVELLQAAKAAAGDDYPIIFRISGEEFIDEGRTIEGTIEICKRMEEAGVDCISVSNGTYYTFESNLIFPYMDRPRATYEPECRKIRDAVKVPLIIAGRLDNPDDAERILADKTADFIAVGRGSIGDPHLPKKVSEGRSEDIRPCLACNYCIGTELTTGQRLPCVVNPLVFRENQYNLKKTDNPKKVLVVGAGPGGMEAARIAAARGHQVTLLEKDEDLGGQLIEAGKPPHKESLEALRQYYITQILKQPIDIRKNTVFSLDMLDALKPDTVIMATGLSPWIPQIPGLNGNNNVINAKEVLLGAPTGDKVAVVGAEQVGCETALMLAKQGKKVTLMRRGPALATKVNIFAMGSIIGHLNMANVAIETDVTYEKIDDAGIEIKTKEGEKKKIEADTIVFATGGKPNNELFNSVKEKIEEVYCIGDCVEPRSAREAILEGFNAGIKI